MNEIVLTGCRPEPLSSYLRALGVLRLVATQSDDPLVTGCWRDDAFVLKTRLSREELTDFFVNRYSPTPMIAPWNGGSGFYEGDTVDGINAILQSSGVRFAVFKQTIESVRGWDEMPGRELSLEQLLQRIGQEADRSSGKKSSDFQALAQEAEVEIESNRRAELLDRTPDDLARDKKLGRLAKAAKKLRTAVNQLGRSLGKERLVDLCRSRLGERAVDWLDCVLLLNAEGEAQHPPLLGTGGNDGRFEYTNAFMQRVAELLLPHPSSGAANLLANSLFGDYAAALGSGAIGQFDPGRAGGPNQGHGIYGSSPRNPWDYILAMEGCVLWANSIVRRCESSGATHMSGPFTVLAKSIGYGSASAQERGRAEVWAPLWRSPTGFAELRTFFGEGRAEVGRRRAKDSLEFAQSVCSLGVDRGVHEFVRYSFLERRGKSYIGLPTGRFLVHQRREADFAAQLEGRLDRVDGWLRCFSEPPAGLNQARRQIDEAVFEMLAHGSAPRVLRVFEALGRFEKQLSRRTVEGLPHTPPGKLSPVWLTMAGNSLELRLAAALASLWHSSCGSLRRSWLPLHPRRSQFSTEGWRSSWLGNSLSTRLASVLNRRVMEWTRADEGVGRHPVSGSFRVSVDDAIDFLEGHTDDSRLETLLMGLSWVDWSNKDDVKALADVWKQPQATPHLTPSWSILKLAFADLPLKLLEEKANTSETGTRLSPGRADRFLKPAADLLSLLMANRVPEAQALACQRFRAAGLPPKELGFPSASDGPRLAASLCIPTWIPDKLVKRVIHPNERSQ